MSETKSVRKLEEIQKEYQNVCVRAGHTQYQIATLETELDLINTTLRDLNLEAASTHAAEKKAAEEVASKSAAPESVL